MKASRRMATEKKRIWKIYGGGVGRGRFIVGKGYASLPRGSRKMALHAMASGIFFSGNPIIDDALTGDSTVTEENQVITLNKQTFLAWDHWCSITGLYSTCLSYQDFLSLFRTPGSSCLNQACSRSYDKEGCTAALEVQYGESFGFNFGRGTISVRFGLVIGYGVRSFLPPRNVCHLCRHHVFL
uniref:Peptidase A1 domain-containing protein n=1 Tax=Steinernema glaseri TaxID=37863 RepID=A0A1I7YR92_9BILA